MSSETHWGSDSANVGLGDDCPEPTYAELQAELEKYVLLESGAVAFEIQMQSQLQDLTQQNQRLKGIEAVAKSLVESKREWAGLPVMFVSIRRSLLSMLMNKLEEVER